MLDSMPAPLQAILWPLLGAAFILITRRLLPNWLRRTAAMAAALASLLTLRALIIETAPLTLLPVERLEVFWEPVNLFRLSPALTLDNLSLLMGITLAGTTAAAVLGIRGAEPKRTVWHALILVTLAGFLIVSMAADLLMLALGSAVLDLGLAAMAVSAQGKEGRSVWRMAVPGFLSTSVILVSALQMSAEAGTASLQARDLTALPLVPLTIAGMLRLLVYPLHPRGLRTPESGVTLLLLANTGLFLVIRAQGAAQAPGTPGWGFVVGIVALLAGGLLAWTGALQSVIEQGSRTGEGASDPSRGWLGIAVHQAGYALAFLLSVSASRPWPMISVTLAASMLAIWWDGTTPRTGSASGPRFEAWRANVKAYLLQRLPRAEQWRGSWLVRHGVALLPAVALVSLVGIPVTVGALGRWPFYAALLNNGQAAQLIAVLVADTLLAAALWMAMGGILKQAGERRPGTAALLALAILALAVVIIGVAPRHLGLEPAESADVSLWSLGILYVLPWLAGAWLGRYGARAGRYSAAIYRIAVLDWVYRAANWVGQQLVVAVHWLSRVGEGEGWWGWALIILLLGAMLLIIR
jgi:hypothetical protein